MLLCVALCHAFAPGILLSAPSDEAVYLEQLRSRRLFSIAEGYCLRRLADESLSPAERITLSLHLSGTFVAHAQDTTGKEQQELWNRANEAVNDVLEDPRSAAWTLFLRAQLARILAAQGIALRWQLELTPQDKELRDLAQSALQKSTEVLTQLDESVTTAIQEMATHRETTIKNAPQPHEFRELRYDLRLELGTVLLNLAHVTPEGTADRTWALTQAERWLDEVARGDISSEAQARAKLLFAQSTRLRRDLHNARRVLSSLLDTGESVPVLELSWQTEQFRLLLAEGRSEEVLEILQTRDQSRLPISAEMRFLGVRALADRWEAELASAADEAILNATTARLETAVGKLEEQGGYWAVRARQLLERLQLLKAYGKTVASFVDAAQLHYQNQQWDAALEAFRQAANHAWHENRHDVAMELGYQRASLMLKLERLTDAEKAFHDLATAFPNDSRAPAAHLLWAATLGKRFQADPSPEAEDAYLKALSAHRQMFSESSTAYEAAWLLAEQAERQGKWSDAISLYGEIPSDHRRSTAATRAIARGYQALLESKQDNPDTFASWSDLAIADLEKMLLDRNGEWGLEHAEVALALTRILMQRNPPDAAQALPLLERILRTATESSQADWNDVRQQARQQQIVALAGSGRAAEAQALLKSLAQEEPDELLSVLDGLIRVGGSGSAETQSQLAELQLATAKLLETHRGQLDDAAQRKLDLCHATAALSAGRDVTGLQIARDYIERHRATPHELRRLADSLAACTTRECHSLALDIWQRIEKHEKAGSPAWLSARYHVCRLHFELGDKMSCVKLLRVTRLLYPDLGGTDLKSQFERLESKLNRS